jgi:hypothetical protein
MNDSKLGCVFLGMGIALFTIPFYHWALGEFSIFVTIPLGLIFAHILYKYSVFGKPDSGSKKHRIQNSMKRKLSEGKIYIDKYGRIIDPTD